MEDARPPKAPQSLCRTPHTMWLGLIPGCCGAPVCCMHAVYLSLMRESWGSMKGEGD